MPESIDWARTILLGAQLRSDSVMRELRLDGSPLLNRSCVVRKMPVLTLVMRDWADEPSLDERIHSLSASKGEPRLGCKTKGTGEGRGVGRGESWITRGLILLFSGS
jgi:hypothetical protein